MTPPPFYQDVSGICNPVFRCYAAVAQLSPPAQLGNTPWGRSLRAPVYLLHTNPRTPRDFLLTGKGPNLQSVRPTAAFFFTLPRGLCKLPASLPFVPFSLLPGRAGHSILEAKPRDDDHDSCISPTTAYKSPRRTAFWSEVGCSRPDRQLTTCLTATHRRHINNQPDRQKLIVFGCSSPSRRLIRTSRTPPSLDPSRFIGQDRLPAIRRPFIAFLSFVSKLPHPASPPVCRRNSRANQSPRRPLTSRTGRLLEHDSPSPFGARLTPASANFAASFTAGPHCSAILTRPEPIKAGSKISRRSIASCTQHTSLSLHGTRCPFSRSAGSEFLSFPPQPLTSTLILDTCSCGLPSAFSGIIVDRPRPPRPPTNSIAVHHFWRLHDSATPQRSGPREQHRIN